jgi:hypothetical protein
MISNIILITLNLFPSPFKFCDPMICTYSYIVANVGSIKSKHTHMSCQFAFTVSIEVLQTNLIVSFSQTYLFIQLWFYLFVYGLLSVSVRGSDYIDVVVEFNIISIHFSRRVLRKTTINISLRAEICFQDFHALFISIKVISTMNNMNWPSETIDYVGGHDFEFVVLSSLLRNMLLLRKMVRMNTVIQPIYYTV